MNEYVCIGEVALRDKTGEYSEPVAVYVRREDLKRITMGDLVEMFARIMADMKRETNPSTASGPPPLAGEAMKEDGGRAWDT